MRHFKDILEGSAKKLWPGYVNAAGKLRQRKVVSNSSNKVHQTWPKPSQALYAGDFEDGDIFHSDICVDHVGKEPYTIFRLAGSRRLDSRRHGPYDMT